MSLFFNCTQPTQLYCLKWFILIFVEGRQTGYTNIHKNLPLTIVISETGMLQLLVFCFSVFAEKALSYYSKTKRSFRMLYLSNIYCLL